MKSKYPKARARWELIALLALFALATSCTMGTTGSSENVTVSGQIASGTPPAGGVAASARSALSGYQIRVYSVGPGGVSSDSYSPVEIGSDGSFSFSVASGQAFVAILVNPNATFRKAIGVIAIGTGSQQYWEQIETSQIKGNIEMGTIPDVPVDGILITQNDIAEIGATVQDPATVKLLSRIDNSVGFLINSINEGPDISTSVNYVFGATDDGLLKISGAQPPSPPYYSFGGYNVIVYDQGAISTDTVELVPPSAVAYGDAPDATTSTLIGMYFRDHFEFGQGDKPGDHLLLDDPSGFWKLLVDGTQRAELQYGIAPPTSLDGSISVPIPLLRVTLRSGTDIIDTISISWVVSDGTGGYTEVSPQQMKLIFDPNYFHVEVADFRTTSSGQREGLQFDPASGPIRLAKDWHTTSSSTPTSELWAQMVSVSYGVAGVGVNFADRQS